MSQGIVEVMRMYALNLQAKGALLMIGGSLNNLMIVLNDLLKCDEDYSYHVMYDVSDSYHDAMASPEADKWQSAAAEGMRSLVDLQKGRK